MYPEDVHFERDQTFVRLFHEHFETGSPLHGLEFKGVVVVAERHSSCFHLLAGFVQDIGQLPEYVEAAALGGRNIGKHNVLESLSLHVGNGRVEFAAAFEKKSGVEMDADRLELSLFQGRPNLGKVAPGGLDFAIANILNRFQYAGRIGADDVADGVQLNSKIGGREGVAAQKELGSGQQGG